MVNGRWLADAFAEFNAAYFTNRLSTPLLQIARLEAGLEGRYLNALETGGAAVIMLSRARARSEETAADTLLHEMVHHAVAELCRADSSDHGQVFCNVANEIGAQLGLGKIRPQTRAALYWPGSLR